VNHGRLESFHVNFDERRPGRRDVVEPFGNLKAVRRRGNGSGSEVAADRVGIDHDRPAVADRGLDKVNVFLVPEVPTGGECGVDLGLVGIDDGAGRRENERRISDERADVENEVAGPERLNLRQLGELALDRDRSGREGARR